MNPLADKPKPTNAQDISSLNSLSSSSSTAVSPIRIVLVEDHDLTRVGMRITLQKQGHVSVVGEADNGTDGLNLVESLQPDVAIVDIGLPDVDGIEVTRQIKQQLEDPSRTKVLILTLRDNEQVVLAAFAAGADSYCMKDVSSETLVEAIQKTSEGYNWIDPAIAGVVLKQTRLAAMSGEVDLSETIAIKATEPEYSQILEASPLTERELEVLQLIVEGSSNAVIAEKLYITVGTVKTHVRNILNKLCADDRTQAAVRALRSGLIR
jgi:two-component system, NarL family, response regulator LiaR